MAAPDGGVRRVGRRSIQIADAQPVDVHVYLIYRHPNSFLNIEAHGVGDAVGNRFDPGAILDHNIDLDVDVFAVVMHLDPVRRVLDQSVRQSVDQVLMSQADNTVGLEGGVVSNGGDCPWGDVDAADRSIFSGHV